MEKQTKIDTLKSNLEYVEYLKWIFYHLYFILEQKTFVSKNFGYFTRPYKCTRSKSFLLKMYRRTKRMTDYDRIFDIKSLNCYQLAILKKIFSECFAQYYNKIENYESKSFKILPKNQNTNYLPISISQVYLAVDSFFSQLIPYIKKEKDELLELILNNAKYLYNDLLNDDDWQLILKNYFEKLPPTPFFQKDFNFHDYKEEKDIYNFAEDEKEQIDDTNLNDKTIKTGGKKTKNKNKFKKNFQKKFQKKL